MVVPVGPQRYLTAGDMCSYRVQGVAGHATSFSSGQSCPIGSLVYLVTCQRHGQAATARLFSTAVFFPCLFHDLDCFHARKLAD